MKLNAKHQEYMQVALAQAEEAYRQKEVPVGCVIANSTGLISKAYNKVEKLKNPLMHAELIAINEACKALDSKFLQDCDIYTTLEPCKLCMEAISMVRLKRVFFATNDPNKNQPSSPKIEVYEGIMQNQAKNLLLQFFQNLRKI